MPGPLMTAPRVTFRPLLSVSRLDTQSAIFMRRSVNRSTASVPARMMPTRGFLGEPRN
jgi:hypothetical protein